MTPDARVILFHKQATSARTRFLRVGDAVCHRDGLPRLTEVLDLRRAEVVPHPVMLAQAAAQWMELPTESVIAEHGFREEADVPAGPFSIYLLRLQSIDPPFAAAERVGGRFVDLTEARDVPPIQLELLRRAYVHVMG